MLKDANESGARGGDPEWGGIEVFAASRGRRLMTRRMAHAASVPVFHLHKSIDASGLLAYREVAARAGVRHSVNDLVVHATAGVLREHGRVNGGFVDGQAVGFERVNIGIAVAVPGGLVVPTLKDADRLGLVEVSEQVRLLLAKSPKFALQDLVGGTFTISNLGMFGVDAVQPTINPPQAAILGVGALRGGGEVPAEMSLSLTCDHRSLTGAEAAAFLADLARRLESV